MDRYGGKGDEKLVRNIRRPGNTWITPSSKAKWM